MIKVIEKSSRTCSKCNNKMDKILRTKNDNGTIWVIKCLNCESK